MALSQSQFNNYGLLRIGGSLQDHINYNFTKSNNRHCDPYPMVQNASEKVGYNDGCFSYQRRRELQERDY